MTGVQGGNASSSGTGSGRPPAPPAPAVRALESVGMPDRSSIFLMSCLTAQEHHHSKQMPHGADSQLDAVEQAVMSGEECKLNAIGSPNLVEDSHEMGFDRVFRDRRSLGDLPVRVARHDRLDDFELTSR